MSRARRPRDVDAERVEAGDELVRGAADVVVGAGDLEHGVVGDLRRRLHDRAAVDRDEPVGDERRRVRARAREPSRGQRGVEARGHRAAAMRGRGPASRRRASSSCSAS